MTRLAVVVYPTLGESERLWLESIRAAHDPQARLIAAHFTLVFPADADRAAVMEHVAAVCGPAHPIPFAIARAEAIRDMDGAGAHVFLVPDEGGAELAALHRRLYEGPLQGHLRSDIPFVPHITVGAYPDLDRCRALARDLDAPARSVRGTISRLDVVAVTAESVESLLTTGLGSC